MTKIQKEFQPLRDIMQTPEASLYAFPGPDVPGGLSGGNLMALLHRNNAQCELFNPIF